jgi:hypothetical protein
MNSNFINNVSNPLVSTDCANKQYVDAIKKKQTTGLFPQQWYLDVSYNEWVCSASSEFSSSFTANNVTTTNGEWASNGVTTNFWVMVYMNPAITNVGGTATSPNLMSGVEPYAFSARGRVTSNEDMQNWSFQVSNDGTNFTTLYTSSVTLAGLMYANVNANGVTYRYFRLYATTASTGAVNPGVSHFQCYCYCL